MAELRNLTVRAGGPVELGPGDLDALRSLKWLQDPDLPAGPAQALYRTAGMWWATNGIFAAASLAGVSSGGSTGDFAVTFIGDEVVRSNAATCDPKAIPTLTRGLRRWVAAPLDRSALGLVETSSDDVAIHPIDVLLEQWGGSDSTAGAQVPHVDAGLLETLIRQAPAGPLRVHYRGMLEPIVVTGAAGWRGVLAGVAPRS